jgi:hypothetical protein
MRPSAALLGVHDHGGVEVAKAAADPGVGHEYRERRQDPLLDALAVLRGELQLPERVA